MGTAQSPKLLMKEKVVRWEMTASTASTIFEGVNDVLERSRSPVQPHRGARTWVPRDSPYSWGRV